MQKNYKKIITAMFSVLISVYINVGYANEVSKIAGIKSFVYVASNGSYELTDFRDGEYLLKYTLPKGMASSIPAVTVMDVNKESKIVYNDYGCSVDLFDIQMCEFRFKHDITAYKSFFVKTPDKCGGDAYTFTGNMPTLEILLDETTKKLILKQHQSETIEITEIEINNKNILGNSPITLEKNKEKKIDVDLTTASGVEIAYTIDSNEYRIKAEFEMVANEAIKDNYDDSLMELKKINEEKAEQKKIFDFVLNFEARLFAAATAGFIVFALIKGRQAFR